MASESYVELVELAASFVHEIKNHVSTLGLNLQLLAEDFQEPQTQRERRALERVQRLQTECQQLVDLSNDVLRFARVKDLELAPSSIGAVIDEMVDFFSPTARQASIEIKSYVPADLPPVALEREMFKQALLNLMLNAHQAMPGGGELTIQTSLEPDRTGAGQVCIDLIDTGQGISQDLLHRVFRPFFSTRPGGTGLGLATTRKIIEAHGGTIDVQSELDRGTKFTIRLPACSDGPCT